MPAKSRGMGLRPRVRDMQDEDNFRMWLGLEADLRLVPREGMRDVGQHFGGQPARPGEILVVRTAYVDELHAFDLATMQVSEHRLRGEMGQLANQKIQRFFEHGSQVFGTA